MSDDEQHTFSLVLAFDTDDEEFARGIEAGIVWEALGRTEPWDSYGATVHGNNAEMMVRMAEAKDRPLTTHDSDPEWFSVTFEAVRDGG